MKYFGTDGLRGRVGEPPMTVDFALRLASAVARVLIPNGGTVVIGKDTRVSGYMFESALEAGFVAAGVDVKLLGPLPTPAIAVLTRKFEADLGVVISASHNPYFDNGIKFFNGEGQKLSDELEVAIEAELDNAVTTRESALLGKAEQVVTARLQYEEFCLSTVEPGLDLAGLKIVLDSAHGAAYKVAPRVLSRLGAEVVPIGSSPNGRNINDQCGSTHPDLLRKVVMAVGADLGIALDGDGDRVVMVDHNGVLADGDQLIYIIARDRKSRGELRGPVVGTVMSNLGLENTLHSQGIEFLRAAVGDRKVLAMLHEHDGILGGETSGHIICLDKVTTGDGLVAALQILEVIKRSAGNLAELAAEMPRYPQTMINVRVAGKPNLDDLPAIRKAVAGVEATLGSTGRVVLRPSGTEPVIRVMVEGEDEALVRNLASELAESVEQACAT
ncbi:MAG: phosphoglucosamine mutase [Gammaproteobacteria bacterium]|nr:MAG: phosphoglucosamine mutase [Gammaproteobacteria bacterium]